MSCMPDPHGFTYEERQSEVLIFHHGARAVVLRGRKAADFLSEVAAHGDGQLLMARVTGNYKRGNERAARDHPRNSGR